MKKKILIVAAVLVVLAIIGSALSGGNGRTNESKTATEEVTTVEETNTVEVSTESETTKETVPQKESFEIDLGAGHYTVGKDIPAGVYNLSAVSGSGNVSSSNMFSGGLNEVMGNPADEYSTDSFSNAKLEDGVVLNIGSTLILHLQTDEADTGSVIPRSEPGAAPIELSSGNFIAGTDFPAGVYTIVATGSTGNVSSDNLFNGGLNEVMGTGNDGFSIIEFKNAELPEGNALTISGTSVQLIQVGE